MLGMLNRSSIHIINIIHIKVGNEFVCEDGKIIEIIRKDD